jgi:hypothetical protein
MKWGNTEFEIEGVADKELKNKINYLYETFKLAIAKAPMSQNKERKKSLRKGGGRKPPFYKNNIRRIIDEEPEWFVEKDAKEVADKLKTEYGVPGAKETVVSTTLKRFFKNGLLTRKEAKGKYLYSVTSLKKANK